MNYKPLIGPFFGQNNTKRIISAFAYLKQHLDVFSCSLEELRILTAQRITFFYHQRDAQTSVVSTIFIIINILYYFNNQINFAII